MSIKKPSPRYGWSNETALQHSVDPVVREGPSASFCFSDENQDAWRAEKYDILRANDIDPNRGHIQVDATKLIGGSAFERALQESNWVREAFGVMSATGTRRALPSGAPALERDSAKDTVFVSVPAG